MRRTLFGITIVLLAGAVMDVGVGCASLDAATNTVPRGTQITHVQAEFGLPDVIADRSGDQMRFYSPFDRPAYEWPVEAPRIFYYLDRDLAITFVRGKSTSAGSINPVLKATVLQMGLDETGG